MKPPSIIAPVRRPSSRPARRRSAITLLLLLSAAQVGCTDDRGRKAVEEPRGSPANVLSLARSSATGNWRVEEWKVNVPWVKGEFALSPDGKRFAIRPSAKGQRSPVFLDGRPGPRLDRLDPDSLTFSPNSQRLGYAALVGKSWHVVIDGELSERYESLEMATICFSLDSSHVAFYVREDNKLAVVVDGKFQGRFYGVRRGGVLFSPDSMHFALVVTNDHKKSHAVLDGKAWPEFDRILSPQFSPDSRHFAVLTQNDADQKWMVDGEIAPGQSMLDGVGSLQFSPGGGRVGLMGYNQRDDKWRILVDGKPSERLSGPWDMIAGPGVVFSPDGRHTAYAVAEEDKWKLVVDGKVGREFQGFGIDTLKFDPDPDHMTYLAKWNGKWQAVVRGETKEEYATYDDGWAHVSVYVGDSQSDSDEEVMLGGGRYNRAVFSPDYKRVASIRNEETSVQLVLDGKPGPKLDKIDPESIAFSADSKHLVYVGTKGERHSVVLDNELGPLYDEAFTVWPRFQADGGVRYLVRTGDALYIIKHFPLKP